MERKIPVIRAGLIGTAIVSGTLWMVWLLNINTTTKYQVLMGALYMVWIRRILGAVCLLSIGGIAATSLSCVRKSTGFGIRPCFTKEKMPRL